ncbi:MAG: extracellular solute-binding protein [Paenibacillaceae bacterium]|nr:extracellular solute-binding protein [Paenibacillaceae bacterium]
MGKMRKGALGALASVMMMSTYLVACSSSKENTSSPSTSPSSSTAASASPKPSEAPKITKIKVELWDRGNQPAGTPALKDNVIVKWVNQQLAPLGVEVEYVQIPRAEESTKLSVWLASGDSPDVILTYDIGVMNKYAEQGGLWDLGAALDKFGPNIKKNNKAALDVAGVYKDKRYAIPALRGNPYGGANMSIRKDWLDKLGLPVPKTVDELTAALKAFKEKDPGGVGKDKVVPWGLPALTGNGQATFMYGMMAAFGIRSDGPAPSNVYMQSGNFENGKFTSSVAMPEGKEYFRWMNQLFKDGLISKEFATDANSTRYNQDFANGLVGFMDANNPAGYQNILMRKTGPKTGQYVTLDPMKDPKGNYFFNKTADFGMMIMVPKSSSQEKMEAAVKYLDWMAKPENIEALNSGLEGVHFKRVDGARVPIDPEKNKQELWVFGGGDLEIIQQGNTVTTDRKILIAEQSTSTDLNTPQLREEYADLTLAFYESVKKYGMTGPPITAARPVNDKIGANLGKYIGEAISKVIIAKDFDAEYANLLKGWEANGGKDYDKEVTDILNQMGFKGMKKAF